MIDFLPSPTDVEAVEGHKMGNEEEAMTRKPSEDEPFSALAFKIMSDPHLGKLTYVRVYSGTLQTGTQVLNSTKDRKERIGKIYRMHANKREEIDATGAGDIVAVMGLKDTTTGDTLCDSGNPVVLESMTFPEPVISVAIEPKTKSDQEKLGTAIQRLAEEDPTFRVSTNEETGQTPTVKPSPSRSRRSSTRTRSRPVVPDSLAGSSSPSSPIPKKAAVTCSRTR